MRVFLTGATGFIGSAPVPELINAGHEVLGLARSDVSAQALTRLGAQVHLGSLEDLDTLRAVAASADAVMHTAFNHDFSNFGLHCENDRTVIEALGSVLPGTTRPLIYSGLPKYFDKRLRPALKSLLDEAVAAGAIRPGIEAKELLGAVETLCCQGPHMQLETARRMIGLLIDGMRYGAASGAKH